MGELVKAKLVLADGSTFEGYSFGSREPISGEIVFSTGMVGYTESLTDPSYRGQVGQRTARQTRRTHASRRTHTPVARPRHATPLKSTPLKPPHHTTPHHTTQHHTAPLH